MNNTLTHTKKKYARQEIHRSIGWLKYRKRQKIEYKSLNDYPILIKLLFAVPLLLLLVVVSRFINELVLWSIFNLVAWCTTLAVAKVVLKIYWWIRLMHFPTLHIYLMTQSLGFCSKCQFVQHKINNFFLSTTIFNDTFFDFRRTQFFMMNTFW